MTHEQLLSCQMCKVEIVVKGLRQKTSVRNLRAGETSRKGQARPEPQMETRSVQQALFSLNQTSPVHSKEYSGLFLEPVDVVSFLRQMQHCSHPQDLHKLKQSR